MFTEHSEEEQNLSQTSSKFDALGWALLRWWGILFRTLFIPFVGMVGYFWLEPKSIGDVPFAELTLNQIFSNLFAGLIALGCVYWFFNFPEKQKETTVPESNPYVSWGRFGGWAVFVAVLAIYWLNK